MEIQDQGDQFGNLFKCMVTFSVHEIKNGGPQSFAGLMILDSACQRTCCGIAWLEAHPTKLHKDFKVRPRRVKCSEMFQFGKGTPSEAHQRAYIPSGIAGKAMLVGSAVLEEDIPLLASNTFMQYMGAIINMPVNMVFFQRIGVSTPLLHINGHFAIDIMDFSHGSDHNAVWQELSQRHVWQDPHPECILPASLTSQAFCDEPTPSNLPSDVPTTSSMACSMAPAGDQPPDLREELRQELGEGMQSGLH